MIHYYWAEKVILNEFQNGFHVSWDSLNKPRARDQTDLSAKVGLLHHWNVPLSGEFKVPPKSIQNE